jgi:hypothetical protein
VDGSLVGLYSGLPGNRDERRNYPDHISSSRAEAVGRAGLPHRGGRALVSCLVPFEHGPGISDEDWRCEKNLSRSFKPLAGVVPRPVWRCHSNLPTFRFSTPRRLVRSVLAIVRANRKGPGEGTPIKVAQVKEKFGGLRFYFEGGNDASPAIRTCIAAAAQESFHISEVCGQPGYLMGYNRTRCDEHFHTGSRPEWDERYRKTMTAAGGRARLLRGGDWNLCLLN